MIKDKINFKDFDKLDVRIGTVVKAEVPEWSHWVMKLTVELGEEIGERTIFAGIMTHYKLEEIEDKQFPFVVNMEPKKIGPEGDYSEGMMMAADLILDPEKADPASPSGLRGASEGKPVLFELTEKVPDGTKVK